MWLLGSVFCFLMHSSFARKATIFCCMPYLASLYTVHWCICSCYCREQVQIQVLLLVYRDVCICTNVTTTAVMFLWHDSSADLMTLKLNNVIIMSSPLLLFVTCFLILRCAKTLTNCVDNYVTLWCLANKFTSFYATKWYLACRNTLLKKIKGNVFLRHSHLTAPNDICELLPLDWTEILKFLGFGVDKAWPRP